MEPRGPAASSLPQTRPCTAAEEAMDMWYAEGVDLKENSGCWKRVVGRTVKLTTLCGVYRGVMTGIDAGHAVLLDKVKNLKTNQNVDGIIVFYASDITHMELLRDTEAGIATGSVHIPVEKPSEDTEEHDLDGARPSNSHLDSSCAAMQATSKAAEKVDVHYTVIDQLQPIFGPAMRCMQGQRVLSISAAGYSVCRHGMLCWIQVATKSHVYLFDIFTMGPKIFKNGLKTVLEDTSILKVIHDCRGLSDCLSHQYGIVLSNVFDSQVADVFLFYLATSGFLPHQTRTVDECLKCHLDIEPSQVAFLTTKEKLIKELPSVWMRRPLPVPCLKLLALEVVHLGTLRFVMLDAMMADFNFSVERCLNIHQQSTLDVRNGYLVSGSDLPEELCHLSVLHEIRRKETLEKFRINERGLLVPRGEKSETQEENCKVKQEPVKEEQAFCDQPFPSRRTELTRYEALPKAPGKRNPCQTSPTLEEESGMNARRCLVPVESNGTTAKLPVETLQNAPHHENYEPLNIGLRNLSVTDNQSATQNPCSIIPFSCPAGRQLRMSAPQALTRNLYSYSS